MIETKNALASVRGAVQQGTPTDTDIDGYYVILRNRDGEIVDKQHFSRVAQFVYDYIRDEKAEDFANTILNV